MVLLNINPSSIIEEVEEIPFPPCNLDSDEPPLETDFHREQINVLIRLLKYWWSDRPNFYISGNLTVYYNQHQIKTRDFRGPDIFVVLDTEKRDRRSWMVWDEDGKYPNLVIELLSNSTESVDRGLKKKLYQDVWRVPNYFWFHPETLEFQGYHLVDGKYQAIAPNNLGLLWSDQLELFLGINQNQLRWFTAKELLIPLPEEQERFEKNQERQAKEQALQKLEQMKAILRSQGIDHE
jgi:Uma2 family endonuclease